MSEIMKDKKWTDQQGKKYAIRNIPTWYCDVCEETMRAADVLISAASMADKMRSGEYPNNIDYQKMFKCQ